ncbi:hypothetical protein [Yinghuangia sp. YIM S09857]|uniref:hypothetical protein n=1 Tax=Yinghuangia sp. YIM S09857 TaxID=3436929 RepID=UPI003F530ED9
MVPSGENNDIAVEPPAQSIDAPRPERRRLSLAVVLLSTALVVVGAALAVVLAIGGNPFSADANSRCSDAKAAAKQYTDSRGPMPKESDYPMTYGFKRPEYEKALSDWNVGVLNSSNIILRYQDCFTPHEVGQAQSWVDIINRKQ